MATKSVTKVTESVLSSLIRSKAKLLIYDVRDVDYGDLGIIKNSINIPYYTMNDAVIESIIDKSLNERIKHLVCYCKFGRARSVMAATKIADQMSKISPIPEADVGFLVGGIGTFISNPANLDLVQLEERLL